MTSKILSFGASPASLYPVSSNVCSKSHGLRPCFVAVPMPNKSCLRSPLMVVKAISGGWLGKDSKDYRVQVQYPKESNDNQSMLSRRLSLGISSFGQLSESVQPKIRALRDVQESDEKIEMWFDLPGFSKEDVNISVQNDMLIIKTSKEGDDNAATTDTRIQLPSEKCDMDKIEATLQDGVLYIFIPKKDDNLMDVKIMGS